MIDHFNNRDQFFLPEDLLSIVEQLTCRAKEHPQKLSLTLDELLHSSQLLSQSEDLIVECHVEVGDLLVQCVQRSIEMLIVMMRILMGGGSYLSLSPDTPIDRLNALIELTRPR